VAVPSALSRAVRINNVLSEYWRDRVAFKLKLSSAYYENMLGEENKIWYFGKYYSFSEVDVLYNNLV